MERDFSTDGQFNISFEDQRVSQGVKREEVKPRGDGTGRIVRHYP
jgi:hypothetical protein